MILHIVRPARAAGREHQRSQQAAQPALRVIGEQIVQGVAGAREVIVQRPAQQRHIVRRQAGLLMPPQRGAGQVKLGQYVAQTR